MRMLHQNVGQRLQLVMRIGGARGLDGELKMNHLVFGVIALSRSSPSA